MNSVDPRTIEQAVIRLREHAIAEGVSQENVDPVASAMVVLELLTDAEISSDNGGATHPIGFPETFAEWALHYALNSHYDRFLAVAVYLYEHEQVQAINSDDVIRMYKKARWDKPKNPADVFAKSAQRVWFAEDLDASQGGSKAWRITRTGYDHFQSLRREDIE